MRQPLKVLFSAEGRINRARFWAAALLTNLACAIVGAILLVALGQIIPSQSDDPQTYDVTGTAALPFGIVIVVLFAILAWASICLGIKRFHDRDKVGAWVLIQFVPVIGPFWYFIEVGCLRGTPGPNQFGPDPLDHPVQNF